MKCFPLPRRKGHGRAVFNTPCFPWGCSPVGCAAGRCAGEKAAARPAVFGPGGVDGLSGRIPHAPLDDPAGGGPDGGIRRASSQDRPARYLPCIGALAAFALICGVALLAAPNEDARLSAWEERARDVLALHTLAYAENWHPDTQPEQEPPPEERNFERRRRRPHRTGMRRTGSAPCLSGWSSFCWR